MNKLKVDARTKTSRIVTMIIAVDHLQRCLRRKTWEFGDVLLAYAIVDIIIA